MEYCSSKIRTMLICAFVLAIAAVFCGISVSVWQKLIVREAEIILVIPADFVGVIREVQHDGRACDHREGEHIGEDGEMRDVYVVNIPANGIFAVSDPRMFSRWHILRAKSTTGFDIPVVHAETELPENEVAVWQLGSINGEGWFYVGDRIRYQKVREQLDAGMQEIVIPSR